MIGWVAAAWLAGAAAQAEEGASGAPMEIEDFDAEVAPPPPEETPELEAPPEEDAAGPAASPPSAGPAAALDPVAIEDVEAVKPTPTVKLAGFVRGALGVDTQFDSLRGERLAENVADLRGWLTVSADISLSESARLLLEARSRWRGTTQRGFDRTKAVAEVELGEAFFDFYSRRVDVRVGQQVFALGANAVGAPTDVLNPRDLRQGLLAEPSEAKLPVFGARATGEVGPLRWLVGYVPFFQPHRYNVFGQDEAFLQPAAARPLPEGLHQSVEDALQPHLLETERPLATPWNGDAALQLRTDVGPVRLGVSYAYVFEKTPQVFIDAELAAVLEDSAEGRPVDPAEALSVQNRLRAGEKLYRGTYARQHVVGVEAMALVGPAQLDVDLGWSPKQSFTTDDFESLRRTTFSWAVGFTPAEDTDWSYAVSWSGLAVRKLPADDRLFLLERATARGRERTGWFHLFAGELGYRFLDDKLHASLRAAFEPVVGSFLLNPVLRYELSDRVRAVLWAEFWQGKSKSVFGYFARNDQLVAAVEADLF